jgi:hypothetical protein
MYLDELPSVRVTELRRSGALTPKVTHVAVTLQGDDGAPVSKQVGVARILMRSSVVFLQFVCGRCGRLARILRLHAGHIMCGRCTGLRYWCEGKPAVRRAQHRIERLKATDEGSACEVSEGSPALIDARPVEGENRSSEQTLQRMDVIERDGENLCVPRYSKGRGDDCVESEVAPPAVLIEHQDAIVPQPVASTLTLPVWPGPYPPPPLVAHLYAPHAPPKLGLPPQPGLRMSPRLRGRAVGR